MSSSNSIGEFSLDNVNLRKNLKFPDNTIQTSSANELLYYSGIENYGFGSLGVIPVDELFLIYKFTGLTPANLYLINGFIQVESTGGNLTDLTIVIRTENPNSGASFTYSHLYSSNYKSGQIYNIPLNDFSFVSANGEINLYIRIDHTGPGDLIVNSGQIRALRISLEI